ncbi:MAG: hypothetical protein PHV99_01460 [Candidatus Pacebacteria bacterium]|nr:hypothetical protein [Candidatus Paceibacterota bacterium]
MNRITTFLNSLGRSARVFVLSLAVVFVGAGIAQAATTISTNIATAGTLSVTGLSTLLGGATTTQITLLSGDQITNAAASTTVVSGNLTVGDATAVTPRLVVTNAANATSTVQAGCVQTTATSSATTIKLIFNNIATSTTINGASVAGYVLWAYGTCP